VIGRFCRASNHDQIRLICLRAFNNVLVRDAISTLCLVSTSGRKIAKVLVEKVDQRALSRFPEHPKPDAALDLFRLDDA